MVWVEKGQRLPSVVVTSIPVVDVQEPDFEKLLLRACSDVGFVSVTGHGIAASQFGEIRKLLKVLFALDSATKARYSITKENYRGFIPLGFFTPNRVTHSGTMPDSYEGYKLHWECPPGHPVSAECRLYGPNVWALDGMKEIIERYWAACEGFSLTLLDVFARAMNTDVGEFRRWHEAPLTNMTLLHYPAQDPTNSAVGIHPHKDTNVLTLLHPDPVGGLFVRATDGAWLEATPPADALLVNIGEMLELWSGGRFVATPHQVINLNGSERYSFPFFVVPNHSVVVAPLVDCRSGFTPSTMPVGRLTSEVWRTNWPDQQPLDVEFDLGTLDR